MSEVKEIKQGLKNLDEKYKKDLENIRNQFASVWYIKKIGEELTKIVNNNKNLQEPNIFWGWLNDLYASKITLEICKLIDDNKHSDNIGSLMELLISLKESKFLKENNFIQICNHNSKDIKINLELYKQKISENGSKNSNEMIEKDIGILELSTEKIKRYRDTIIAHSDKKSLSEEYRKYLNFAASEINEICTLIESLIHKYYFFIMGNIIVKPDPQIDPNNYNLSKIFKTEEK